MESELNLSDLPIIDWKLSLKLSGNKKDLAEDILSLTIQALPNDISLINNLYQSKNYQGLLQQVHKNHGALCYVGLPRIKTVIARLETDIKNNIMDSLPSLLNQLNTEVNLLLEYYTPAFTSECSSNENG